jgi:hypothetical protein
VSDLFFLPVLRRGLAAQIATADPGRGPIGPATVAMSATVAGTPVGQDVRLLAPHHVAMIAPEEIVRRYPVPGAVDVETTTFPLIEFRPPDLPWRYTPAGPAAHQRLRPWAALVVVEDGAEGIAYTATPDGRGQLSVAADRLDQLPPAGELWGWAHVQSSRPVAEVPDAVTGEPGALRSRILCPRRLEPGRTYRAALVSAFMAGADDRSEPAWGSGDADLVVYDTWTFTTAAEAGDFESLCELLQPATFGVVGVRAVDVTRPGLDVGWPADPMVVDLVGALADPGEITDSPPPGTTEFSAVVEPLLDDVLGRAGDPRDRARFDPLRDDPVVGLPFYGSWPASVTSVPDAGWARGLNVRTTRRIAAGLGARTVRRNQEALMAAAWDQLGSVREAADELNRGRLSAEVGRSWQARVALVDAGDRIGLAAPLLSFVTVAGAPACELVTGGAAPSALLDRAWLRRTPRAAGASAAGAYVAATRAGAAAAERRALDFRSVALVAGTAAAEPELGAADTSTNLISDRDLDHIQSTGLAAMVGGAALSQFVLAERGLERTTSGPPDTGPETQPLPAQPASAGDVADAVGELDPVAATRAALVARIPALDTLLAPGELPAGLALSPVFTDALFWDLAEIDEEVIVPGLGDFPANRVRLLAVNPGFVGAYLVGANHEMAREFEWREFPADLTATYFARFFDQSDPEGVDILPIADWPAGSAISANLPGAATTTAILIRGDLVRRYPDVNVFVAPSHRGAPDYERAVQPAFEGRLGADALVVGFAVAPETVLGEAGEPEWFVALEERMTAPRFGLDLARDGRLTSWDELAWTDFDADAGHVGTGPIPGRGSPTLDGIAWGRNAAHLAAAVHQRPFRRVFAATTLVAR